jgi:hypothetical protein
VALNDGNAVGDNVLKVGKEVGKIDGLNAKGLEVDTGVLVDGSLVGDSELGANEGALEELELGIEGTGTGEMVSGSKDGNGVIGEAEGKLEGE